jgi:hypothetical protein
MNCTCAYPNTPCPKHPKTQPEELPAQPSSSTQLDSITLESAFILCAFGVDYSADVTVDLKGLPPALRNWALTVAPQVLSHRVVLPLKKGKEISHSGRERVARRAAARSLWEKVREHWSK